MVAPLSNLLQIPVSPLSVQTGWFPKKLVTTKPDTYYPNRPRIVSALHSKCVHSMANRSHSVST